MSETEEKDDCEKAHDVVDSYLEQLSNSINMKKRKVEELEIKVKDAELTYKKLQSDLTNEEDDFQEQAEDDLRKHKFWSILDAILSMNFGSYYVILSHECFGDENQRLIRWLKGVKSTRAPKHEWDEVDIDIEIPQVVRDRLNKNYKFLECSADLEIDIDRTSHNKHSDTTYSVDCCTGIRVYDEDDKPTSVRKKDFTLYDNLHEDWIIDAMLNDEWLRRDIDCDGYRTEVTVDAIAIHHFL